jgi:hypothetical protein
MELQVPLSTLLTKLHHNALTWSVPRAVRNRRLKMFDIIVSRAIAGCRHLAESDEAVEHVRRPPLIM